MNLLIGTFSKPLPAMDAHGEGLYTVSFDPNATSFEKPELIAACINPTSLAFDSASQTIFAGREVFADDSPAVASFRFKDGLAAPLSELQLEGELPCNIALDSAARRIATAQYWTGDAVLSNLVQGVFTGEPIKLQNTGTGPNLKRQQGPHAHCVTFSDNGSVLHIVDLGADLIVSHCLDANGQVTQTSTLRLSPGCGPRHIAISRDGRRAFVICELSEELLILSRAGLGWEMQIEQKAFDLPSGVSGSAAAIRLSADERQVYVSGRRQSRIALFNVAGNPHFVQEFDTGGICPRDFILSQCGEWLFCGNQGSGTVTALKRNSLDGKLSSPIAQCEIGSPVSLLEM